MSNQWSIPLFTSGGANPWTAAQACGLPEFISPIPAVTTPYMFTQRMMMFLANYTALPLSVVHPSSGLSPDYSSYVLVEDGGKRRDLEHGAIQWERRYALKPSSHDEWETFAYNYIGFLGIIFTMIGGAPGLGGSTISSSGSFTNYASAFSGITSWDYGRPRITMGVGSRVTHDYFHCGPSLQAWSSSIAYTVGNQVYYSGTTSYYQCISNVGPTGTTPDADPTHWALLGASGAFDYATPGAIPKNLSFKYRNTSITALFNAFTDTINDVIGSVPATVPDRTTYNYWISNANNPTYGWAGDVVKNWLGGWSSSVAYFVGDQVTFTYSGPTTHHYECIANVGPTGTSPNSDPTHWKVVNLSQFVAEDSRLSRWAGNIYLRQTRYVLAY